MDTCTRSRKLRGPWWHKITNWNKCRTWPHTKSNIFFADNESWHGKKCHWRVTYLIRWVTCNNWSLMDCCRIRAKYCGRNVPHSFHETLQDSVSSLEDNHVAISSLSGHCTRVIVLFWKYDGLNFSYILKGFPRPFIGIIVMTYMWVYYTGIMHRWVVLEL